MLQFTIRRLMIGIAVISVALGLLRYHTFGAVVALYILALFGVAWSFARVLPNLATRLFIPAAIWLDLSLFISFAYNANGDTMLRVNPTLGQMAGFARRKGSATGARREGFYYGLGWGERWNYHDSW